MDFVGNLYLVDRDQSRVRKVDAATGIIRTVAGNGAHGSDGDGGQATLASLSGPTDIALDTAGNLYITDTFNHNVRRVDVGTGIISTVAGSGSAGFSGDGGPSTLASLYFPTGIAIDEAGDIYIADTMNSRIRKIHSSSGDIETIAGNGEFDFIGDDVPATLATLSGPEDLAFDADGNLYIADTNNHRVRRIDNHGIITTVSGNGLFGSEGDGGQATRASLASPTGVALDESGDLYIAESGRIRRTDASTGIITTVARGAQFWPAQFWPVGVAVGRSGELMIADLGSRRILQIDAVNGVVSTFAGSGSGFLGENGPATQAGFIFPDSVQVDSEGNLFVADFGEGGVLAGRILLIERTTQTITTVVGQGVLGFGGDDGPATQAMIANPIDVRFDGEDNLFFIDSSNNRIRRVDAVSGTINTVAGNGEVGFSGDGQVATRASLAGPTGLAVDFAGNIYISESKSNRIRKVDVFEGTITTIAGNGESGFNGDGGPATQASLSSPEALAMDGEGNLFIADSSARIRRVDATGLITTVAGIGLSCFFGGDGGPATRACLGVPNSIAVAQSGDIYISDGYHYRIRRIDGATGIITTVAGNGRKDFSGDGGPATEASLNLSEDVALDSQGNLYIANIASKRVRMVPACVEIGSANLVTPSDGSSGVSTFPVLSWERDRGVFRYDVYLDTENPPSLSAAADIETTSFSPTNLRPLTTYYWRIVAKGDSFCVPFRSRQSEIRSFTTGSSCEVPRWDSKGAR